MRHDNGDSTSAPAGDFRSFRFSSEELPPADRVPFYRDVVGRMLAKADIESVGENSCFNARFCQLRDLSFAYIEGSAVRVNRTREMAKGSDKLALAINLDGAPPNTRSLVAKRPLPPAARF